MNSINSSISSKIRGVSLFLKVFLIAKLKLYLSILLLFSDIFYSNYFKCSAITSSIHSLSRGKLLIVASISFVVLSFSPIIEANSNPSYKIILFLNLLLEILSNIFSKKNLFITTVPPYSLVLYLQYLIVVNT